ncbi:MAG: CAAX protease [Leptolyngbyaceae cyanobacterium]
MPENSLSQFGELVGGAFALQSAAFQRVTALPDFWLALLVVLLAGLSLAVGQSIILFINRVQPIRFVFSLLLNAILFVFGFLFLVFSTWLICQLPWSVQVSFPTLVKVVGLAYAPLLFSFLGALPYLGYPILALLSVWNLLAIVAGFAALTSISWAAAFSYVAFGWFVKQVLENTIGKPIAQFGKELADRVAGVELAQNRAELTELVRSGIKPAAPIGATSQASRPEVRQFLQASGRSAPEAAQAVAQTIAAHSQPATAVQVVQSVDPAAPLVQLEQRTRSLPQQLKWLFSLVLMAAIFVAVLVLLRPIRDSLFGWYRNLHGLFRLVFDIVWIAIVGMVFAGLLAPLETLGWWAGWFGDEVDTSSAIALATDRVAAPGSAGKDVSRYIVYLDGIGQSGEEYTPDVEDFLNALRPSLPPDMALVQGLMMYSVLNKPLDEDRPLAFLWRRADKVRWANPAALLGILVNLRNVLIVAVSSDKRYGPIYNQGIAQVIFDGLIARGYQPNSGIPITLIGYSGGGEMSVASAPYLERSLGSQIEVISLGGVMSANNNLLELDHLYHIVGDKDPVERLGPIMYPGRWQLFALSYWNRAKRKGKITIISAGPVGHQVPGGYMDPKAKLPDGRTNLQQTIEIILQILRGEALKADQSIPRKPSNYSLYQQAPFVHPSYYPIAQTLDPSLYRPIGNWMGRLILPHPEERQAVQGALFEVYHTPAQHLSLVGQVVNLRWVDVLPVQQWVKAVTKDVHFSADAEYGSRYGGMVFADRLNHWRQVNPLESLAGAHPVDDIVVMLNDPVQVEAEQNPNFSERPSSTTLRISSQPVEITGRFYAIVQFIAPVPGTDQFRVVHFNRASRQFDGLEEVVRLPEVMLAAAYGSYPSTTRDLEKSPLNETGWYVYGAKDAQGLFVVQSIGHRALFRLQPDEVVFGEKASYKYIRKRSWADITDQKGRISSVLCSNPSNGSAASIQAAVQAWQEGDRALVIHTYGGIGGNKKEPAAATPIFFGHFAYGLAEVVREPLTDELRFDLRYYQVYTQNTDGLTAGTLHWSRYLGDRQFGWVGTRPTCDLLIKLDSFTGYYDLDGYQVSPLDTMRTQLQVMTARYRIGDGTGGTFVGPANNCSQDSNQALFASIRAIERTSQDHPELKQLLIANNPDQERRLQDLKQLRQELALELQAFGSPRADWEQTEFNLGSTLEDRPLRNLWTGLGSWRTMLPRLASDTIVRVFLKHGASVWVLRTNQIGGYDPDIEPIAPNTL